MSCCKWSREGFGRERSGNSGHQHNDHDADAGGGDFQSFSVPPPGTLNDQSPIALDTDMTLLLHGQVKFRVSEGKFTYQFLPALNPIFQISTDPPKTSIGGENYEGIQCHFHVPAEHPLNGKIYPLAFHFVFGSISGATLATDFSFRLTEGKSHKIVRDLLRGRPTSFPHPFPGRAIYFYTGSLTTPPTDTNINWQVWTDQFCVNQCDIDQLVARGMVQNARALQDRNGRIVALTQNAGS